MPLEPELKPRPGPPTPARMFSPLLLGLALLAGCAGGGLKLDPSASADMQRCGVDLRMTNAFRVELLNDAKDKKLSFATLEELKSTIFEQVPEASRLAVYQSYVDCITSRRSLASALSDIAARKSALAAKLRDRYHLAEADVRKIEAYYDEEAEELRTGKIIGARETRSAMIYELASLAAKSHITLARQDIIATGGQMAGDDRAEAAAAARQKADFLAACRAAADEILCKSMAPVYDHLRSAPRSPG